MDISASKSLENHTAAAAQRTTEPTPGVRQEGEQFGDIWKKVQAQYGGKAEKAKEIKKTLGKDDFLKLMVVQMKNQDPTKPFNADQMAAQMAQYASVEQLQNINQGMGKLTTANQPLERLAMTNMIGKVVTVDRERFPHTEGQNDSLSFTLPKDASTVKVVVTDTKGETVVEKDMGFLKAGPNSFTWDGLKNNTLPAKTGDYSFRIEAVDDKGVAIQTNPRSQGKVVGVSFEGADPVFLVGDPARPDKVTIRNIVKVDNDPGMAQIPGVQSLASAVAQSAGAHAASPQAGAGAPPQAEGPNYFTFKKGVGSSNLDGAPEGFPNGLSAADSKGGE